jgi:threonine dehydratase
MGRSPGREHIKLCNILAIPYSTGNHARAVAMAAAKEGVPATIVMSPDAAAHKVEAVRRLGAKIVMAPPTSEERRELAERLAREGGLGLLPPYDDPAVLAGQGTVGLEILECCEPAAIFVPVGGGGLSVGIGAAVKQVAPQVKVIGVEPELANDAFQTFRTGKRVVLPGSSASIADAVRVQTLGTLTMPLLARYVDDMITVSERDIALATIEAAAEAHLVLEPAGALAIAGARLSRTARPGSPRCRGR